MLKQTSLCQRLIECDVWCTVGASVLLSHHIPSCPDHECYFSGWQKPPLFLTQWPPPLPGWNRQLQRWDLVNTHTHTHSLFCFQDLLFKPCYIFNLINLDFYRAHMFFFLPPHIHTHSGVKLMMSLRTTGPLSFEVSCPTGRFWGKISSLGRWILPPHMFYRSIGCQAASLTGGHNDALQGASVCHFVIIFVIFCYSPLSFIMPIVKMVVLCSFSAI